MAHGHNPKFENMIGVDRDISRNRIGRFLFFVFSVVAILGIPTVLVYRFFGDWFGWPVAGGFIGFAAGIYILSKVVDRFFVEVESASAFLTTDNLAGLFRGSKEEVYVSYGPGFHFSYPWEGREEENNFSLEEGTEPFATPIMTTTGEVNLRGSTRIRPLITRLIEYRSSLASVGDDMSDLVKAYTLKRFAGSTVEKAQNDVDGLNTDMNAHFANAAQVTEFEERFGIIVGDITVAEILPSEAARKTRNAIDEAKKIAHGTAIMLGLGNEDEMKQALADKRITQANIDKARDRFLAASENITMNLNAYEVNVSVDANEKVAEAITNLGPALAAAAPYFGNNKSQPKKGA